MKREQLLKEIQLCELVRNLLMKEAREIRQEKSLKIKSEARFRRFVREMVQETTTLSDKNPHQFTGINVLEDLLKKIIPLLEDGYKMLTSSEIQRLSFRAHVLNGIMKTIAPPRSLKKAEAEALLGPDLDKMRQITSGEFLADPSQGGPGDQITDVLQEAEFQMEPNEEQQVDNPDDEAFIPVDSDTEPDERDQFGKDLEFENDYSADWVTGRNVAFDSYSKIQKNIMDSYEMLGSQQDRQIFYTYLLTNVKLYFDKFESEISLKVPEPTTQEYEKSVDQDQQYVPQEDFY